MTVRQSEASLLMPGSYMYSSKASARCISRELSQALSRARRMPFTSSTPHDQLMMQVPNALETRLLREATNGVSQRGQCGTGVDQGIVRRRIGAATDGRSICARTPKALSSRPSRQ